MKDKPYTTASDLLKAIHVHEETKSNLRDQGYHSFYKLTYDGNRNGPIDKYTNVKEMDGYRARVSHVDDELETDGGQELDAPELDRKYEDAYYHGVIQAVKLNEESAQCFNCNIMGHKW